MARGQLRLAQVSGMAYLYRSYEAKQVRQGSEDKTGGG
jgi:hypothetical protein